MLKSSGPLLAALQELENFSGPLLAAKFWTAAGGCCCCCWDGMLKFLGPLEARLYLLKILRTLADHAVAIRCQSWNGSIKEAACIHCIVGGGIGIGGSITVEI